MLSPDPALPEPAEGSLQKSGGLFIPPNSAAVSAPRTPNSGGRRAQALHHNTVPIMTQSNACPSVLGSSGGRSSPPAPQACAAPQLSPACAGCNPLQCGLQPARGPSRTHPALPAPCLRPAHCPLHPCTLHPAPCIPAPCTLHPWTLHPALCPLSLAPYTLHPEPLHPACLLGAVNQGEAASVGRAGFINQHLISAAPVPGTPRTSHCAQGAMLVGTAATSTRGIGVLEGFGSKRCFQGIPLPALLRPPPPQPRALHAAPLRPQTPLPSAELQPQPEGSSAGGGRGCFSPIWDQFGMGRGPLISPVCHTQNF